MNYCQYLGHGFIIYPKLSIRFKGWKWWKLKKSFSVIVENRLDMLKTSFKSVKHKESFDKWKLSNSWYEKQEINVMEIVGE